MPVLSSSSVLPLASSLPPAGPLGFVAASADPVAASAASSALFRPFDVASAPPGVAPSLPGYSFTTVCSDPLPSGSASAPLLSASVTLRSAAAQLALPPSEAPRGASFHPFAPGPSASAGPPPSAFAFAAADDFDPGLADPEAPVPSAVPDSVRAEIRRMYAYLVDLFPQAAGSPSDPPHPRALFKDFFAASTSPHQPVFLAWFEHVHMALAEADSRLASVLASGRADASILPQRVSQYTVRGEFASGAAVPVNPSLLSMFEHSLRPSLQLGISLRKAAILESSSRFHSEALSHSLWLLSGVLAFVRLQGFLLSDASLFNTMVTSLSKCLAHQASLTASMTAFLGLKRRQFYLSHLPAYVSDANKRSMLAAPVVCAYSLFAEADIARLLADTQTSSSLRSQQALVNVASRGSEVRRRRSSPARSPSHASPARRHRRESGSPSRQAKRFRLDSPAPSSAMKGKQGFWR